MTTDGVLCVEREELAAKVGLPARTLNRHLRQAVDDGWLVHERVGRKNVGIAIYVAGLPWAGAHVSDVERPSQQATHGEAEAPVTAGQPVARIKEIESERSERVVVKDSATGEVAASAAAHAVGCGPQKSSIEEEVLEDRALATPATPGSSHVCGRDCFVWHVAARLYDRER
jgi:hypothetical protein